MTRLEKIRLAMREHGFDALIVFDELNQRYLSDFAFTDGLLLITAKSAYMLTDFRYYEMALQDASREFKVEMTSERDELISGVFSEEGIRTVGFEGGFVSFELYERYCKKFPAQSFQSVGNMIEEARQVKSEDELEKIARAQQITDRAFSHMLGILTPNMTEIEVAAELEYFMRRDGADGFAFDTIAVSGDASALPHGTPRREKLKAGFLTMDFGARLGGYCSDMTRTVVIGAADAEIKKIYNTTLRAQEAALAFLKAGVDAGEADKVARDIIDKEYEGAFGHSLGHSVGLFIHEQPSLSKRSFGRALRAGEVVTVEPGIYIFGKYGCRIEDMVAITEGGIRNFTASTKELIEII
ncbi:MAG: aminopeptidase P family protein [Clostridia bacterium]|nr:aminopeptidase P family protein [Clostridia bacterium]